MGKNFSWTAKVDGKAVADGTSSGGDDHTADRVEQEASLNVSLAAGVPRGKVDVTVTERKSNRQQVAEARAARNGR
ncbi:hypothetical protein ABZ372_37220 [Streptomyces sp. NPDC005921]|uniref:hypothetical protein n=1 Tax=Streptomyces sp. NPDC005827 TaxID=3157070 RepID=UPI0033ED71F8